ncbi:hypothetical protein IKE83_02155 [Candidatus Saccharibacteria bacterium]|nr:hypothetical protein [Candidatus Saccharibacteria bacterium]
MKKAVISLFVSFSLAISLASFPALALDYGVNDVDGPSALTPDDRIETEPNSPLTPDEQIETEPNGPFTPAIDPGQENVNDTKPDDVDSTEHTEPANPQNPENPAKSLTPEENAPSVPTNSIPYCHINTIGREETSDNLIKYQIEVIWSPRDASPLLFLATYSEEAKQKGVNIIPTPTDNEITWLYFAIYLDRGETAKLMALDRATFMPLCGAESFPG